MRKLFGSVIAASAGILLPALGAAAAPATPSVPSYGAGYSGTFVSTIGPGGVPAGPNSPAISSTTPVTAGFLQTFLLPNGDVEASFVQGFNDNTYGTNADPRWGKQGHKFQDLVGSDKAEFVFKDGLGNTVLDFDVDYIDKAKGANTPVTIAPGLTVSYPSGYGTLGVLGGDGKVNSGNASNIKYLDTTLTDDLNNPEFNPLTTSSNALVNSPNAQDWNKVNGYTVIVSAAAFGSNGFGSVSIPGIHDSPAEPFATPVPVPPTVYGAGALTLGLLLLKKLRPAAL